MEGRGRRPAPLLYWTLLAVAFPGYIVMRRSRSGSRPKEHLDDLPDDPAWLGIGYITADLGRLSSYSIALILGGSDPQVARGWRQRAFSRRAAPVATLLVAAYVVTVWAMGAKPT